YLRAGGDSLRAGCGKAAVCRRYSLAGADSPADFQSEMGSHSRTVPRSGSGEEIPERGRACGGVRAVAVAPLVAGSGGGGRADGGVGRGDVSANDGAPRDGTAGGV